MTTNVLSRKAMLTSLSISSWGARKHESEITEEVLVRHNAEKETGSFTKRLLNSDAMEAIGAAKRKADNYHKEHTLPWHDAGKIRILPAELYPDFANKMRELKAEFYAAVDEFLQNYPKYMQDAKRSLGKMFNEADYPPLPSMRRAFKLDILIMPCPESADFRCASLSPEDLKDLRSELGSRVDNALEKGIADAARRAAEVIANMSEKLAGYKPADKKKGKKAEGKFHDSLVEHVRDLAGLLPAFNLNEDPKLTAIHKRIVKELCAYDADTLRADDDVRKQVATSAAAIHKAVSEFLA